MALLSAAGLDFVTERHLATLTTLRPDGTPARHPGRLHLGRRSRPRVRDLQRHQPQGAQCRRRRSGRPVPGRRAALADPGGDGRVSDDPDEVAEAVDRYARRYRPPRVNPARVAIIIDVARLLGSSGVLG